MRPISDLLRKPVKFLRPENDRGPRFQELKGTLRDAVEVSYHGTIYFLDDEDGSGWLKVTEGKGSPYWTHRSLPDDSVVVRER